MAQSEECAIDPKSTEDELCTVLRQWIVSIQYKRVQLIRMLERRLTQLFSMSLGLFLVYIHDPPLQILRLCHEKFEAAA